MFGYDMDVTFYYISLYLIIFVGVIANIVILFQAKERGSISVITTITVITMITVIFVFVLSYNHPQSIGKETEREVSLLTQVTEK
jgi:hypothetical protein